MPPHLTLKNFEGLDLGKIDKVNDMNDLLYILTTGFHLSAVFSHDNFLGDHADR